MISSQDIPKKLEETKQSSEQKGLSTLTTPLPKKMD
jgi:hypothetical protein